MWNKKAFCQPRCSDWLITCCQAKANNQAELLGDMWEERVGRGREEGWPASYKHHSGTTKTTIAMCRIPRLPLSQCSDSLHCQLFHLRRHAALDIKTRLYFIKTINNIFTLLYLNHTTPSSTHEHVLKSL